MVRMSLLVHILRCMSVGGSLRVKCLIFLIAALLPAADWAPLDQSDLQSTTGKVDAGSDAEALFWDVRLTDEIAGETIRTVLTHYVRIKIYTDRGREKLGTIDLPYLSSDKISDIAGRTISPSGEITELGRESVFEREILKTRGVRVRSKSFALPAVTAGSIVEYRWRETKRDQFSNFVRLQFQREVPVQRVTYHIKPLSHPLFPFAMRSLSYQIAQPNFQKEKDGFYALTLTNLPAFVEEPFMPAEERVRAWTLIYYAADERTPPEKYWPKQSAELFNSYKGQTKPNGAIREAAAEAIGSETSPEGKLRKLYQFVRKEVRNVYRDPLLTNEQRSLFKENNNAADTLKQGLGTGYDIGLLYIALASAVDLDVRLVRTGVNNDAAFSKAFTHPYLLRGLVLAAKMPDGWRFFDPMYPNLPFGMLSVNEEGTPGLIADSKGLDLVAIPGSEPKQTLTRRTATMKLAEDGTLEGTIRIEYTGHEGVWRRFSYASRTEEEILKSLSEDVQRRWPHGEVSDTAIANVKDPEAPLTISYRIKTPGYAERTGRRLFIRPSFFQWNYRPRFTESERRYPIEFEHPWSEVDKVSIELPVGFSLDNATAPQSFNLQSAGAYKADLLYDKKNSVLLYNREFDFGRNRLIIYPQTSYPQVRKVFQVIQEQDDHAVALKQEALRVQ